MKRIDPAPSAPHAVRYVSDDGEYAVNFTYSLGRNLYDAQVWRLVKGRMWARAGDILHTPCRGLDEITEERAERYVLAAREREELRWAHMRTSA